MRLATTGCTTGCLTLVAAAIALAVAAEARSRGPKRSEVSEIIVHATGGPACRGGEVVFSPAGTVEGIKRFFEQSSSVSIHYIIGRDGEIARSVPEDEVAYHARDHNESSIGIELINAGDGREPYPEAQVAALVRLIKGIRTRWDIPFTGIKGHEDVDRSTFVCAGRQVRRKQDPGAMFPWDRFRRQLEIADRR